jgi:hypothetical protein
MKVKVVLAFHNRVETLEVFVREGESLIRLKNELETTPRVISITEVHMQNRLKSKDQSPVKTYPEPNKVQNSGPKAFPQNTNPNSSHPLGPEDGPGY